jgi:glycosyltransferase involved in cell wall biosynthesis
MTSHRLRINLIARNNGVGLSRDMSLLCTALRAMGHEIHCKKIRGGKLHKHLLPVLVRARGVLQRLVRRRAASYDLNLLLEHVRPEYFSLAHHNILLPNPEWLWPREAAMLGDIDRVFAKTRHAETIFAARDCPTSYIGFTSPDRLDRQVPRQRSFFHLAGSSRYKGTERLLALWREHPEWPTLTVVQHPRTAQAHAYAANIDHRVGYQDDAELKRLQNAHRFHLCPSETEGFGHYLVEAMSVGAVAITVDGAPMNELVQPERGVLIAYARSGVKNLAPTYYFDEAALAIAVEHVLELEDVELDRLGAAARAWYETNDRAFSERLGAALAALEFKSSR